MKNKLGVEYQKGVGLIEVLVTVLILSTALLTMASMQTRSLQYNHSAYLRSQANILAYDILDRARINRGNVSNYDIDLDDSIPNDSGSLAQRDMSQWRTLIDDTLPGGRGSIACDGAGRCSVTIDWLESNISEEAFGGVSAGGGGENRGSFSYTTNVGSQ